MGRRGLILLNVNQVNKTHGDIWLFVFKDVV